MALTKCLYWGGLLLTIQMLAFHAYFFFGWSSSLAPMEVEGSAVIVLSPTFELSGVSSSRKLTTTDVGSINHPSIVYFDQLGNNNTKLVPKWNLHGLDENVSAKQVNVNSCFRKKLSFHCLPAVYIVGFEKCGTTVLNIWLSYHPNLKTNWMEARFFDQYKLDLEKDWHGYLSSLPRLERSDLGKVWTFEKSPAYSTNPTAAEAMKKLVPDARILFLTRNPTQRAYSMFLMYTHHYVDVSNAVFGTPMSFFVRNNRTNSVHYVRDYRLKKVPPGVGGTTVDPKYLRDKHKNETWIYLEYPPSPYEFHKFVDRTIKYLITNNLTTQVFEQTRGKRVLTGGMYANFLEDIWLKHFEPHQLVLAPSETFFENSQVLKNMKTLQDLLGLPNFNYSDIASNHTGRMEIPSSLGTILNKRFNANVQDALPMLPKTKRLLDDFYCESNRRLRDLMGGRALPSGYACGDGDFTTNS